MGLTTNDVYTTQVDLTLEKKVTVILDAAHGADTPGKRSPDGIFREYVFSRSIITIIKEKLEMVGYSVFESNPTENEIGLSNRKEYATNLNAENKLLVSIHNNAAGNGSDWLNATGMEFYTTPGFSYSDIFAECLVNEFSHSLPDEVMRTDKSDGDSDKESKFTVLMGAGYWACLAEILFMDSKKDIEKLMDIEFMRTCADAFVNAIELFNTLIQK